MAQPLFPGLRSRMLSAIDEGMSCRAAAARIGVAPSSAIRSHASRRDSGSFAPELQGGTSACAVSKSGGTIFSPWESEEKILMTIV